MCSSELRTRNSLVTLIAMAVMVYTGARDDTEGAVWEAGRVKDHPWLYFGSLSAASSPSDLTLHNVTRVLTVARRLDVPPFPPTVRQCVVEIDDHPRANFLEVAARCIAFIDEAAKDAPNGSLLVHCASVSAPFCDL